MSTKTAGTAATTSLTALQWQASGMNAADLATLNAAMRNPVTGGYGSAAATSRGYIENGRLYLPDNRSPAGINLVAGDWIMVDGAGWPVIVPSAIFATSWVHS